MSPNSLDHYMKFLTFITCCFEGELFFSIVLKPVHQRSCFFPEMVSKIIHSLQPYLFLILASNSFVCGTNPIQCGCVETYQPVCGSDWVTYINACVAQCHKVSFVEGSCVQVNSIEYVQDNF